MLHYLLISRGGLLHTCVIELYTCPKGISLGETAQGMRHFRGGQVLATVLSGWADSTVELGRAMCQARKIGLSSCQC